MHFTKMEGAGNDYVYINLFEERMPADVAAFTRRISDRHFGVGSDGVIFIAPSETADAKMIMYNADGSYSEMCGNGVRCVAKFVHDSGIARRDELRIETGRGILPIRVILGPDGNVTRARVNLNAPILAGRDIPTTWTDSPVVNKSLRVLDRDFTVTCVSMGNPHCITYVDDVKGFDLHRYGPAVERHANFPNRVNFEIVQSVSPGEVIQRTWERGTGETLACGTGAAAVCVAGVLTGRGQRAVRIHLPGGDLDLEWNDKDNNVYKTGPARVAFEGEWTESA